MWLKVVGKSTMKILASVRRGLPHYPWDYMLFIFAAWAIPAAYGLLNRYFIGYMTYESVVTEQSFEALEVLMEVFLEMFPLAVLALVARDFQQQRNVQGVLKTSLVLQLGVTVSFTIAFIIFAGSFIDWINTPQNARPLALNYFRLRTLSLPFTALSALFLIAIKALRKGRMAILLAFVGVVVNFGLDVLLISNFPFSLKLGLIGSAMDNLLASFLLTLVSAIAFLATSKRGSNYSVSAVNASAVVRIGKWTGLESLVRNVGYIVGVVALVNIIGAAEPAAIGGYNTAMWVMWGIVLIPILSWTEATQIAIGNAYGGRDVTAMRGIQITSCFVMGLYMLAWALFGQFAWKPISKWLNSSIASDVVEYSRTTFIYLIAPYTLFAVGSGLKTVFIGTGRPVYILICSTVVNALIYIPLGLLAKYAGVKVDYILFLQLTIVVFTLDFALTILFLIRNGYRTLPRIKAEGAA
jgi:Na+-driven multidrug efflux pump